MIYEEILYPKRTPGLETLILSAQLKTGSVDKFLFSISFNPFTVSRGARYLSYKSEVIDDV